MCLMMRSGRSTYVKLKNTSYLIGWLCGHLCLPKRYGLAALMDNKIDLVQLVDVRMCREARSSFGRLFTSGMFRN